MIGFFMLLFRKVLFGHRNCPAFSLSVLAVKGHLEARVILFSLCSSRAWVPLFLDGRRSDMSLPHPLGHVTSMGCCASTFHLLARLLGSRDPQSRWDVHGGHQHSHGGCLVKGTRMHSPIIVLYHECSPDTATHPISSKVSIFSGLFLTYLLKPSIPAECSSPIPPLSNGHHSLTATSCFASPASLGSPPLLVLAAVSLFVTRWHGRAASLGAAGGYTGHGTFSGGPMLEGVQVPVGEPGSSEG